MDLVAPRYVGSSWTRDRTCVPVTGKWIPIHSTTREVLVYFFNNINSTFPLSLPYALGRSLFPYVFPLIRPLVGHGDSGVLLSVNLKGNHS